MQSSELISNNEHPRVSVISIALHHEEFEPICDCLKKQTYQDYEFIGEAGGSIPEAWNRAIRRARGEILVFTETDARALNEYWLDEMVSGVTDSKQIAKGLEVTSMSYDISNLAAHRDIFLKNKFDPSFHWVSDSELICRLIKKGFKFRQIQGATVINLEKDKNRHYFRHAFNYGFYWARLNKRYPGTVEIPNNSLMIKRFQASLYQLLGLMIGSIVYLPEHRKRGRSG